MAHLAVDLGANGGKLYLGRVDDGSLSVREVHRFDNRPVERDGRYVWDVERLRDGVVEGLRAAAAETDLTSVGVDTWGVDFGLLRDGELLQDPYSYRDPALSSTVDDITDAVGRRELFAHTGINHWNIPNTLWQYHYLAAEEPDLLARADRLVMTPQLVSTLLGARPAGEVTIASTSQMLDPRTREWATGLLGRLGLPTDPLPRLRSPDARVGSVDADLVGAEPDVVLPASHDTASAVAGLPLSAGSRAFLSTGTWFIVGVELDEPILTDEAFDLGASNELGADGTVRFLRNINGFFLLEECREAWRDAGVATDYDDLLAAARGAPAFGPLVNPDDPLFGIEGTMPERIRRYCEATDQAVPDDRGALVRCILESLAAKTALTLADLLEAAGASADRLHLGGGGVHNDLFCGLMASAADRPVHAGPADATAVGNILTQAAAAGAVADLDEGRRLVSATVDPDVYDPADPGEWTDALGRMRDLLDVRVGEA